GRSQPAGNSPRTQHWPPQGEAHYRRSRLISPRVEDLESLAAGSFDEIVLTWRPRAALKRGLRGTRRRTPTLSSRRGTTKASLVLSTGSPRPLQASAELDHAKYL